jgi:hypothetical protein
MERNVNGFMSLVNKGRLTENVAVPVGTQEFTMEEI